MNSKIAEQGVVIVIIQDGDKFLFQLNPKWNDLSFIGGKIESSDKSPLDAAYRECEEELDIKRNTDYELSPLPPGIFQEQKMSKRTGKLTNYTFHIFILKPKRNIDKKLNALGNIWMKKEEVENPPPSFHLSEIVKTIFPVLDI